MSTDRLPAVRFRFTCEHGPHNADAHHVDGHLVCERCGAPIHVFENSKEQK